MDGHLDVNGARLAHSLSGDGPAVVLLHGWMCSRRFWREQVPLLSRPNRVLALDFRGHGKSEVSEGGYTIEQLAEDVHAVMRALNATPAVLVGHFMGGMVAQQPTSPQTRASPVRERLLPCPIPPSRSPQPL